MVSKQSLLRYSHYRSASRGVWAKRHAVHLLLFIYCLMLIEGVLRKWVVPQLATPLFFLRDPFVVYLYFHAARHRLFASKRYFRWWLLFGIVSSVTGLVGYIGTDAALEAWMLGVRGYWIYVPLGFVAASVLTRNDCIRFIYLNLLIAIPYSFLVIVQYQSPGNSFVNKLIAEDSVGVGLGADVIRPAGLFTWTGQNVGFTAFVVANFVAAILMGFERNWKKLTLGVSAIAICSMAVLTGSRSIYFLVAGILSATTLAAFMVRPTQKTVTAAIAILAIAGFSFWLLQNRYPDMYEAMLIRLDRAEASEGSIFGRASSGATNFVDPLLTAPVMGHGIGRGTPSISAYLGEANLALGESDLSRNVNELGPAIGLWLVGLRYMFAFVLISLAFRAARLGDRWVLPFAGLAAIQIGVGQWTHSSANAFLPWLAVGLVLAALGSAQKLPFRQGNVIRRTRI